MSPSLLASPTSQIRSGCCCAMRAITQGEESMDTMLFHLSHTDHHHNDDNNNSVKPSNNNKRPTPTPLRRKEKVCDRSTQQFCYFDGVQCSCREDRNEHDEVNVHDCECVVGNIH